MKTKTDFDRMIDDLAAASGMSRKEVLDEVGEIIWQLDIRNYVVLTELLMLKFKPPFKWRKFLQKFWRLV